MLCDDFKADESGAENRLYLLCCGAWYNFFRCFLGWIFFTVSFSYTMMLAALAILGHRSAASFATGPRASEPRISPSVVIMTAALSSN